MDPQRAARRGRRIAAVFAAIFAIALVAFVYWKLEASRLAADLVARAGALAKPLPRAAQLYSPLKGSFAERARPALEALERARARTPMLESDRALLDDVAEGLVPTAKAPAALLEALEESGDPLARLLEATRAESGGLPEAFRVAGGGSLEVFGFAADLAALQTTILIEQGRPERAVELCADGLALSLELSSGSGFAGRLEAGTVLERLTYPCARAIDRAPLDAKRSALARIVAILDATPPFSLVLADEQTAVELIQLAPDRVIDSLDEPLRSAARERRAEAAERGAPMPASEKAPWKAGIRAFEQARSAAKLALRDREGELTRIEKEQRKRMADGFSNGGLVRVEAADRLARARLVLLATEAALDLRRAESGRWPDQLPPLTGARSEAEHEPVRDAPPLYYVGSGEADFAILEAGESPLVTLRFHRDAREAQR